MLRSSALAEEWPQGSAEYLSARLSGPDYSCPHPQKLKAGIQSKIPSRLGFFHVSDEDLSYLDTEKLCQSCYEDVVPGGFLVWSTYYANGANLNPYIDGARYHEGRPTAGDGRYFPLQLQAGTEHFGSAIEPYPSTMQEYSHDSRNKAIELVGDWYDRRHYEKNVPCIPGLWAEEAWRGLRWAKMPFYVDLLHLHPPFRGDLSGRQQKREFARIARQNAAAYLGAVAVVNSVPEGGFGPYTASEHRLAEVGSYRLITTNNLRDLPPPNDNVDVISVDSESRRSSMIRISHISSASSLSNRLRLKIIEIHPQWALRLDGLTAKHPNRNVWLYPTKSEVDAVTKEAIGTKLKPTADEALRRKYDAEIVQTLRPSAVPTFVQNIMNKFITTSQKEEEAANRPKIQNVPHISPLSWNNGVIWGDMQAMDAQMPSQKASVPPYQTPIHRAQLEEGIDNDDSEYDGSVPFFVSPMSKMNINMVDRSGVYVGQRTQPGNSVLMVKPPIREFRQSDLAAAEWANSLTERFDLQFHVGTDLWIDKFFEELSAAMSALGEEEDMVADASSFQNVDFAFGHCPRVKFVRSFGRRIR